MGYGPSVTATTIIEEIKRLAPEQQMEVIQFTYELAKQKACEVRIVDDEKLQKSVDRIFTRYADLMRNLAS